MEYRTGDLLAAFDRMRPIHQNLGLHDRHYALFLAQGSITGQRVGVHTDTHRAGQCVGDTNHRPPLGESRAHRRIFLQTVSESIESFGHFFFRRTGEHLRSAIHFDARNNSLLGQYLGQRYARRILLPDGFVL